MLEVGEDGSCVVQFDGVIKKVAPRAGEGLSLAFAMTVHKAQGSEFPRVFIPMHTSSFMLLRRRLFYTAVSRAKRDVTIVGTKQAIGMAISRNERPRRTILRGLLGGLDQASLIDPALLAGADDDDF
jgi:exodeoxyribonuclease V alpha subunit